MTREKQPKQMRQMTIGEWEAAFPHEDACRAYLVAHRWPEDVCCPRCGNTNIHTAQQDWNWNCYQCSPGGVGYRFSHITGTIFENTNKPLRDWFRVVHIILTSKKGVSALQVHRTMGFGSYRTAWYMCHRIRAGLATEEFNQLIGIVEVDETFVGGKSKNRHFSKRGGKTGNGDDTGRGGTGSGKIPVIGAVSRKGTLVARVIKRVDGNTRRGFVRGAVSEKVSLLVTDHWIGSRGLDAKYSHKVINHSKGRYVVGVIHTNTIEGFWSVVKRGMVGTFHNVSAKYLPLYIGIPVPV